MPDEAEDDDSIALLRERLQAARRALSTAYDQRDALAEEVAAAEAEAGAADPPHLPDAFSAAERAVFAAEAERKMPNTLSPSRGRRRHPHRDQPPQPICNRGPNRHA